MTVDNLLARLEGVKRVGDGRWKARCPSHKDRTPSLSVREFEAGKIGVHCFGGCSVEAVLVAVGLTLEDLFPQRVNREPGDGRAPERRPYTSRQVLDALVFELGVVWHILSDLSAGRAIDGPVRKRAGVARERCVALIEELRLAR